MCIRDRVERGFGTNQAKWIGKVYIKKDKIPGSGWCRHSDLHTECFFYFLYGRTCDWAGGNFYVRSTPLREVVDAKRIIDLEYEEDLYFQFQCGMSNRKKAQVEQLFVAAIISVCTLRQQCARFIIVLLRRRILSKLPACFISHSQSVIQPFLIIF